jgi:hypothetical protein
MPEVDDGIQKRGGVQDLKTVGLVRIMKMILISGNYNFPTL